MATALAKLRTMQQQEPVEVDPARGMLHLTGRALAVDALDWDVPVGGTVIGTLLNFKGALAALGDAVNQPPYKAPPKAPVLYIKPVNTLIGFGRPIPLPAGLEAVEVGPALGVVIGRTACRVSARDALDHVQGYTILDDVTVPHQSVYRPAIRQRCRDGFCPIGPWVIDRRHVPAPDALGLRVRINGTLVAESSTAQLVRPVARLIADVTEFMTLSPGDVLHVGVPENAPRARAGDRVRIEIDGVGWLENPVIEEAALAPGAAA